MSLDKIFGGISAELPEIRSPTAGRQRHVPPEARGVRDRLRKHSPLVRQRIRQALSIENLVARNTGRALSGHEVKRLTFGTEATAGPTPRPGGRQPAGGGADPR